jgi:hypothetical protein
MDKYRKALFIIASKPAGFTEYDMQELAKDAIIFDENEFDQEWYDVYLEAMENERRYHTYLNAELEDIIK